MKWVSNHWVNVWVLEREHFFFFTFLTRLIVFFQAIFVYFVMSNLLNTPVDCPHTVGIPVCAVSKPLLPSPSACTVLFILLLANLTESSFPWSLYSILFSLLCWLTYLITALQSMVCFFLFFTMRQSEVFTCWRASRAQIYFLKTSPESKLSISLIKERFHWLLKKIYLYGILNMHVYFSKS